MSNETILEQMKILNFKICSVIKSDSALSPTPWFYIAVERYVKDKYASILNPVKLTKAIGDSLLPDFKVSMADSPDGLAVILFATCEKYETMETLVELIRDHGWPVHTSKEEVIINLDTIIDNRDEFKDCPEYDLEVVAEEIRQEAIDALIIQKSEFTRPLDDVERVTVDHWLTPIIDLFNSSPDNHPVLLKGIYGSSSKDYLDPNDEIHKLRVLFKRLDYIDLALSVGSTEDQFDEACDRAPAVLMNNILYDVYPDSYNEHEYYNLIDNLLLRCQVFFISYRQLCYIRDQLKKHCPDLPELELAIYTEDTLD